VFELANPWFLTLLVLPFMLWYLVPRAKVHLPTALKVPFFDAMVPLMEHEKPSIAKHSTLLLPLIIWSLLILALSGPRWMGEPRAVNREGYNIMMAMDLSGSMELMDMLMQGRPASRLAVVKRAAEQFVQDRTGDRIGLILFGTRAYLQTPLTYDRHNVLMRLEDATAGLAGKTTSIGDALGLAVKHLEELPGKGRIIILLTDGANNSGVLDPLKAAELAKEDGIKVYTIGLGAQADNVLTVDGFLSGSVTADLDEPTLKKIAHSTGGRYFRATNSETLQSIYATIHQLETVDQEQASVRPQKEYYPWFAVLALLVFFYWMLRRKM
jgi:Ca-activated chloride channel family protein